MSNKIVYQKESPIQVNNREDVVAVIEVKQGLTGAGISFGTVTADNVLVLTDARGTTVTCGTISAPVFAHASLTDINGSTFGYHLSEDELAYVQATIASCISTVETNLISATTSIAANSLNISQIQTTISNIQSSVSTNTTNISNIETTISNIQSSISNLTHASLNSIVGSTDEYHVSASQYSWVTQDLRPTANVEFASASLNTASLNTITTTVSYQHGLASPFVRLATNSTFSLPEYIPGCFRWDETHHTAKLITTTFGTVIQIGQEEVIWCTNNSGATIYNTEVVYLSNGATVTPHAPNITPALASNSVSAIAVGVATQDIPNGMEGFVTVRGEVHNIDTSSYTSHTPLYLSAITAGSLSPVRPMPPNYAVQVAWVLESAADGSIYIDKNINNLLVETVDRAVYAKEPTGFINNTAITSSYDSTNRTITLTGDLRYAWRGYIVDLGNGTGTWTSDAHPIDLDTTYFLYSSDGENFTWETSVWDFHDLMIAFVWNGTEHKYGVVETHGVMNWQAHEEFHEVIGTYKQAGGILGDYTLSSTTPVNRRPSVSAVTIKDEDIYTIEAELLGGTYTRHWLINADGTTTFNTLSTDIVALSGNRPYYNQWNGSTWTQTLMPNNTYMSVWLIAVPVTSDPESQAYRFFWKQGQTAGSLEEQQSLFPQDLTLGTLPNISTEFVFIAKVIILYSGGNWTLVEVQTLTGSRATTVGAPSGAFLSVVSSDNTLNGVGTVTDPLVVSGVKKGGTLISGVHTLSSLSVGNIVISNTNAAHTVWIPSSASSSFATYSEIDFVQLGTGALSVSISGDTLRSRGNLYTLNGQYAKANLLKVTSTQWVLSGDLV